MTRLLGLLRPRRKWKSRCRAADKRNELASSHCTSEGSGRPMRVT
jgi:hypothetical protein